jgi:hypothetical protein
VLVTEQENQLLELNAHFVIILISCPCWASLRWCCCQWGKNSIAFKFLDIVKSAVFDDCDAHKLNLVLCDATSQVKDIADVFYIFKIFQF